MLGKLFIVSGPSGVGKDTIVDAILAKYPKKFKRAVTYTTRRIRPEEKPDRIYHFVSQKQFRKLVKSGKISEWAKVHGNYYGGSVEEISKELEKSKNIIFDIDVKGALRYKKEIPEAILIFLKYEDLSLLPARLKKTRPYLTKKELEKRLTTAIEEMRFEAKYDYPVVNPEGKPAKAIEKVEKIIKKHIIGDR